MHANRHSLKLFGMLGAVFFTTAPASAQCTYEWLPGDGLTGLNDRVRAAVVYDDGSGPALYISGLFTIAGDAVANRIAKWDGTTWSPLGSGVGGQYPYVTALTVYNGELIAGGNFTTAGGMEANKIARWDGNSWSPVGSGMNGTVFVLAAYNGELIAGGNFNTAGGTEVNYIARWAGKSWLPLASGMRGLTEAAPISALRVYKGKLIAGGGFTIAGGRSANHIARWDGKSWSPLGSGVVESFCYCWECECPTTVRALAVYKGQLIAGGNFTTAGGMPADFIANWGPDVPLGDLDGDCTVGVSDLLLLLVNWGPCADCDDCPADIDGNCTVGASDLLILLVNWG